MVSPKESERRIADSYLTDALADSGALLAPALQRYEIASALAQYRNSDLLPIAAIVMTVVALDSFPVSYVECPETIALVDLAVELKISAYDAAYVLAAKTNGAALCTLDKELKTAARQYGCKVAG